MMYVFFCLLNIVIMTNIFFQALARYQAFVSRVTDSLAKPGVKKHLGAAYKPLFEANLSAFEVSSIPQPSPNKKHPHRLTTIPTPGDQQETHRSHRRRT